MDSTTFAVGRSGDLTLFRQREADWISWKGAKSLPNVLAVDWLTPKVVMGGLRNKAVVLYDLHSRGSALRLRHSGAVTNIRRVDEWRVVITGADTSVSSNEL
jgi:hypothetical protein